MRPSLLAALSLALVVASPGVASADEADHRTVFTFDDPAITESSGLVARSGVMFTVNDSGDGPYLYAVDSGTGDTVGVTTYSSNQVSDVEAIAPGPAATVWVGDIGDNNNDRPAVDVYRVPVGPPRGDTEVDADRYGLAYPDGPQDAEALLVHPTSGRVYVVSKGILGGTVYAVPASPQQGTVNRMSEVGQVPGLVTDGAFFPDGRHIVLRSYGTAAVYTFPALRQVGRMDLPAQEQGEAVAVDDRGRVFLSTEGAYTEVLQILLPRKVRAALGDDDPTGLPSPAPVAEAPDPTSDRLSADEGDGVWIAGGTLLVTLLVTLAGWLLFTASRRRSPRRR